MTRNDMETMLQDAGENSASAAALTEKEDAQPGVMRRLLQQDHDENHVDSVINDWRSCLVAPDDDIDEYAEARYALMEAKSVSRIPHGPKAEANGI